MWLRAAFLLLVGFLLLLAVLPAKAGALYKTDQEGFSITLYSDPCEMREVTNLKWRAMWIEDGKKIEGCWAPWQPFGVIGAYFADKTVAVIPIEVFEKVQGV